MEESKLNNNNEIQVWGIHTMDDKLFLQEGVIAIGWKGMGDLSKIDRSRDAFKERYKIIIPDAKKGSIANGVGIVAEVDYSRVKTRLDQGWVSKASSDLKEVFAIAKEYLDKKEPIHFKKLQYN